MPMLDTSGLRCSGDRLAGLGEAFEAAIDRFRERVREHGEPWGDDELGSLIGDAFPTVGEWVLDCCLAVADEFQLSGDDLAAMADSYALPPLDEPYGLHQVQEDLGWRWHGPDPVR